MKTKIIFLGSDPEELVELILLILLVWSFEEERLCVMLVLNL